MTTPLQQAIHQVTADKPGRSSNHVLQFVHEGAIPNHHRLLVHRIYTCLLAFRLDFWNYTRIFSTLANERSYAFFIPDGLCCTSLPAGRLSAMFVSSFV